MEIVTIILEILKYILPAIVVLIATHLVVKKFLDNQLRKISLEMRMQQQNNLTPIRLQAYERAILFLERITPSNIVMRINNPSMSASELHQELLKTIRAEYEHNLTQQVYISKMGWTAVKRAKEETIKIINISSTKINSTANGLELRKAILDAEMSLENIPTQIAIDMLKEEVRAYF